MDRQSDKLGDSGDRGPEVAATPCVARQTGQFAVSGVFAKGLLALILILCSNSTSFAELVVNNTSKNVNEKAQLKAIASIIEKRELSKSELEQLGKFVIDHPTNVEGHTLLSRAYDLAGLQELALEQAIAAWESNRKDILTFVAAQSMALQTANRSIYDDLNSKALVAFEDDFRSLNTLAAIGQKRGDSKVAREFLQAALRAAPNDADTRVLYMSALLSDHRYADVLKQVQMFDSSKLTTQMKSVIASFKGIALLRLRYPNQAVGFLEEAFNSTPTNLSVCSAYFDALVSIGRYKAAIYPGMMLLALQPPFGDGLEKTKKKLRPVFEKTNLHSSVLQHYTKTIEDELKDPGRVAYFNFAIADLMDEIGNYAQAEILFTNGLNLDRSFGRGYMRLAKVMEKLGRDPEVVNDLYKSALEADSKDPEIVASYRRSTVRSATRNSDLAHRTKTIIRSLK